MKYFYDTEFLEGTQSLKKEKRKVVAIGIIFVIIGLISIYGSAMDNYFALANGFLAVILGIIYITLTNFKSDLTIDLISIGIVDEDDNELYLISKEFNISEAWNRYQMKQTYGDARNMYPNGIKEYWIRHNVLKPIFDHFIKIESKEESKALRIMGFCNIPDIRFTKSNFTRLVKKYGSSRKEIASKVSDFTALSSYTTLISKEGPEKGDTLKYKNHISIVDTWKKEHPGFTTHAPTPVELYAWYADYDHVALCWLFGKMLELPDHMPMFTHDLKQENDRVYLELKAEHDHYFKDSPKLRQAFINKLSLHDYYPRQAGTLHDALEDAKWNKQLYSFLSTVEYTR